MDLKLLPLREQRPTSRANLTRRARCKAAAFSKVLPGRDPLIDCFADDWMFWSLKASDIVPCMDSNPPPINPTGGTSCVFSNVFSGLHATRAYPSLLDICHCLPLNGKVIPAQNWCNGR